MSGNEIFGIGFGGLDERTRLRRAAQELEGVVLAQLMSAMRETVPDGGFLGSSATQDLFRSMLDAEIARDAATRSPFGLADALVADLESRRPVDSADAPAPDPGPAPGRTR